MRITLSASASGAARQRRSRHVAPRTGAAGHRTRAGLATLAATLLIAGCGPGAPASGGSDGGSDDGNAEASPSATTDPALEAACADFWGDPTYRTPLSRDVLDRAATAPEVGAEDPFFYAITGDDIEDAFTDVTGDGAEAAAKLADWFRTEPEKGKDADREAFRAAWDGVAAACSSTSVAAAWAHEPGEDGTKPAALVCADIIDTPGTLTHFANANVLTSNMFDLVGRVPQSVPADRMDDVRATDELLAREAAAVDDPAVAEAIGPIRQPFQDAIGGDMYSDGLQGPLDELAVACGAAGYEFEPSTQDDEDGGLV